MIESMDFLEFTMNVCPIDCLIVLAAFVVAW